MGEIAAREVCLSSMEECVIRCVEKEDALHALRHTQTVGGETDLLSFGGEGIELPVEDVEKEIECSRSADNHLFILAEIDGKIVATLRFSGGPRARVRHTGEFGMAVQKAYWRKGVGKALLAALIDWARSTGIRKINLRVMPENSRAVSLYHSFGFREQGRVTREYLIQGEFYDNIIMGLEL